MQKSPIFDRPLSISWGWCAFVLLLLLQYSMFCHRAQREVTWAYPANFDQTGYLTQSYETFEEMRHLGFVAGLKHGWSIIPAQGKLMHMQAAVLYVILGPSRLTALTLNFVYLALLEFFLLYTVRWLANSWSAGWMGLGLQLATTSRFRIAGGMMDFRIDFIASCLLGIMVCLVIRSGVFRYRGWSMAAGVAAAVLMAFRFLSTVLVGPLWGAMLAFLLARAWMARKTPRIRKLAMVRVWCLLLGGSIALLLVAPVIIQSWDAIRPYYFGHVTGGEYRTRLVEYGVQTFSDFLRFYPESLYTEHLGKAYFTLFAVLLLGGMWASVARGRPRFTLQAIAAFAVASFAVPLLVLTVWPSRSPVVGTMLTLPAVALALAAAVWLGAAIAPRLKLPRPRWLPAVLGGVAMTVGLVVELNGATKPGLPPGYRTDYQAVTAFYEEVGSYCARVGLAEPKIVFDRIWDFFTPHILAPLYYERAGILLKPSAAIGGQIDAVSGEAAAKALQESDLAVLTEPSSPAPAGTLYPYSDSMKGQYEALRAIAAQEMIPLRKFRVFSQELTLYVHPSARVECPPNEWITSSGTIVRASADTLRLRPVIELTGRTSLIEFMGDRIGIRAVVTDGSKVLDEVRTSFKTSEYYRIILPLNAAKLPEEGNILVRLSFDKYVVPKKLGLSEDTRELVLMAPRRVRLLAEGTR